MIKKQFLKSKPVCKATFTLPADQVPAAASVAVVGEFNDWDITKGIPMKKDKNVFKAIVELESGREYQFRYVADGSNWINDTEADKYVATPFGGENCVISA